MKSNYELNNWSKFLIAFMIACIEQCPWSQCACSAGSLHPCSTLRCVCGRGLLYLNILSLITYCAMILWLHPSRAHPSIQHHWKAGMHNMQIMNCSSNSYDPILKHVSGINQRIVYAGLHNIIGEECIIWLYACILHVVDLFCINDHVIRDSYT